MIKRKKVLIGRLIRQQYDILNTFSQECKERVIIEQGEKINDYITLC